MNDTTFKLRVPTTELEAWRAKAGKRGLSAWIRERCNEDSHTIRNTSKRRAKVDVASGDSRTLETAKILEPVLSDVPKAGKCQHHKAKGELCYKCDPCWGYPVIA